jgi:hypothetical protein
MIKQSATVVNTPKYEVVDIGGTTSTEIITQVLNVHANMGKTLVAVQTVHNLGWVHPHTFLYFVLPNPLTLN